MGATRVADIRGAGIRHSRRTNLPTSSIERLTDVPHITTTSSGDDTNFVGDALAEQGLARRIWAKLPLHSLLSVLTSSQAVAVVPRRVAEDFLSGHRKTRHGTYRSP